MIVRPS